MPSNDDLRDLDRLRGEDLAEELGVLSPRRAAHRAVEVRRQVRSGRWQRLGRTAVLHNGPVSPLQLRWAALLSGGDGAALAGASALQAGGVAGVVPQHVLVAVPWRRSPAALTGVHYLRTRHLTAADVVVGALPARCRVARAVVDEAGRASRARARTLIAMVVQQRRTTPAQVRAVLARVAPVRQSVLLLLTLADVEGGAHSLPELQFLDLVRGSGLPLPDRQVVRRRPDGRCYLDAAWERYRLAAEVDGGHHRDVATWEADVLRQDELVIDGTLVVRVLSHWVRERQPLVVDLLRRALLSRGWVP